MSQNLIISSSNPVRWLRTSRRNPCPICDKSGYCEVSDDGRTAHCMRVPNAVPMRHRQGGWLHQLAPADDGVTISDFKASLIKGTSAAEIKPLSPEFIDLVNRALLALCPITEAHKLYLTQARVNPQGCGSLDYSQAAIIARQLVKQFGEDTARRHPALLKVERGNARNYWTIAGASTGILFPAINLEGQILGIQIRKDRPKGSEDRYRWLSHAGLGGTPLTVFRAAPAAASGHMVIITEGYKKAAIAAQTWGCHAVSLAGVAAYKETELLHTLEGLITGVIVLAFDQDKRHNPQVKTAEQRLLRLLAASMPENKFYFLNWPEEAGKGLDDALAAGTAFQFDEALLAGSIEGPRLVNDLPGLVVDRAFSQTGPLYTLEGARSQHRALFDRLLAHPNKSQRVITSPTGTGKSRAADDALAAALMAGKLTGRWLLLAPNKANIVERTGPGSPLGKAVTAGRAAIQQGRAIFDIEELRSGSHQTRAEDCANPQATDAGAARQVTARVVCAQCPFGSDQNWKDHATEFGFNPNWQPNRPWKCETQGYLHSRQISRQAQVVIATKEAYLNNSDLLKEFDGGIIVDEELLGYLVEIIQIDTAVLRGWREKIALKGLSFPAWEQLFKVIEKAFDTLADTTQPAINAQLLESREHLEAAGLALGLDLDKVLADCYRDGQGPDHDGVYGFERHYRHNAKLVLPFRAAIDLLDTLTDKENPVRFTRRSDGSFALVAHIPRRHLIQLLRERTLVVLDATVPPALKMLLPDLKELHFRVKQNLHITQITNALYSKRDLYNPATRQRVGGVIGSFAANSRNHLSIVPLRFQDGQEAVNLPDNSQSEHWGLHRATSRYSNCDSLALVGHHLRPVDFIRAEVIACRAFAGADQLDQEPPGTGEQLKLRLYNHRLANGRAAGRWMRADGDGDIQDAIEHDYTANVIQAIGRLRAALRPDHLPPARVLILCNEPVADLKIDLLTTVEELITNPPDYSNFINNNYMKTGEDGQLVPAFTAVQEGRDPWDDTLIQDETRDTQLFWGGDFPNLVPFPLLD